MAGCPQRGPGRSKLGSSTGSWGRVPPSAAEVERVREQQRRELEVARKQNGYWLSTIRNRLENGDDLGTIGNEDSMIAGLTSDKLAAAAKRYLTEVNRARFVLLPEGR